MNKRERKYTRSHSYTATIGGLTLQAEGRTKREAEKRLRTAFANAGRPTIVNVAKEPTDLAYSDLLTMVQVPKN